MVFIQWNITGGPLYWTGDGWSEVRGQAAPFTGHEDAQETIDRLSLNGDGYGTVSIEFL